MMALPLLALGYYQPFSPIFTPFFFNLPSALITSSFPFPVLKCHLFHYSSIVQTDLATLDMFLFLKTPKSLLCQNFYPYCPLSLDGPATSSWEGIVLMLQISCWNLFQTLTHSFPSKVPLLLYNSNLLLLQHFSQIKIINMCVYFFIFNIISSTRKESLPTWFSTKFLGGLLYPHPQCYSWHTVEMKCLSNE